MLKSIDILIGLTVVLLALSMAVMVITQCVTTIVNSRGRHLRRGLVDLLNQIDPALTPALSEVIATAILTHPLVSGSNTPIASSDEIGVVGNAVMWLRRAIGGPRLGNVVHREEFTRLLIGAATGQGPAAPDEAKTALKAALTNNGIPNPDETLQNIRALALQFERASPELSTMARQNLAILHAAQSDLVAKVNGWFDQTMDRTSQRFTASTRAITFAGAFLVAFALQVDTPSLVNRLAADDALRADFVREAQALQRDQAQRKEEASQSGGQTQATQPSPTDPDEIGRKYRAFLAANGVVSLPTSAGWAQGFRTLNYPGVLLTALLLSLGAPFWYTTLGRLLQLRSVLAANDDAQRTQRQLPDAAPRMGAEAQPAGSTLRGERGDLTGVSGTSARPSPGDRLGL